MRLCPATTQGGRPGQVSPADTVTEWQASVETFG